jgi:hypothetical protein
MVLGMNSGHALRLAHPSCSHCQPLWGSGLAENRSCIKIWTTIVRSKLVNSTNVTKLNADVIVSNKKSKWPALCKLYDIDLIVCSDFPWILLETLTNNPCKMSTRISDLPIMNTWGAQHLPDATHLSLFSDGK